MAFFDANLGSLKLAAARSLQTVSTVVKRLTREPAEFFGLDVGTLDVGVQSDLILIDPDALARHDLNAGRFLEYRELYEHNQMVNRSDGLVTDVYIRGQRVWNGSEFLAVLGIQTLGRALRAA